MNNINKIENEDEGIDFDNYDLQEIIKKYEGDNPKGWQVVIRIYKPKRITKHGSILLPTEYTDKIDLEEKFRSLVGLVVKMAPGAYKGDRYSDTGIYCKVGDWVMFKRSYGDTYVYKGMDTITIDDDRILKTVDDPRDITRISAN